MEYMATEQRLRLRWVGNGSKRYDGRHEDVSVDCIVEEDCSVPLQVGSTVRVRGVRARVWTGVVVEILEPPSALELALLVKCTCRKLVIC